MKNILTALCIIGTCFTGFFVLDSRHAHSEKIVDMDKTQSERAAKVDKRILKVENRFDNWETEEKIRKLKKRIEEIEKSYLGKLIPPAWVEQIEWLREQVKELKKKLKGVT